MAAGALICQRAGATLKAAAGGEFNLTGRSLLCCTPKLAAQLTEIHCSPQ
jgi:fructose-1,6-bisphosphatase/inositol monophosphatase family enzyme